MKSKDEFNPLEMEREDEINLLEYWRVVRKRWRTIAGIFGVAVVVTAIVSLLMTPIYRAKTTIIPIGSSQGRVSAALRSLSALPFAGSLLPGVGGASTDKIVTVLKSRTVAEAVIQNLNLLEILFENDQDEPISLQGGVRFLTAITEISDDRKELITITITCSDPKIAAQIANQYTIELQGFLNKNALSMAKRNRIFIEDQLQKVKMELREAEEALKRFQTDKKIIAMDAQTGAAIQALADLKGKIMAKEVQLGVIKQFSTPSNPDVLRVKDEIRELKKQLRGLESKGINPKDEVLPSLSEAPTLGLQYARLKRGALTQEKVFELLTQQYEIAKIDEAKEDIAFQVIDRAIPPDNRFKPKRKRNVKLAGFVSLVAGIFLAFFMEYLGNLKEPKEDEPSSVSTNSSHHDSAL